MRRRVGFCFLTLSLGLGLGAQSSEEVLAAPPGSGFPRIEEKKTEMEKKIAFAVLDTPENNTNLLNLGLTLTRLWKDSLGEKIEYYPRVSDESSEEDTKEKDSLRQARIKLAQVLEARDKAWLTRQLGPEKAETYKNDIAKARAELQKLVDQETLPPPPGKEPGLVTAEKVRDYARRLYILKLDSGTASTSTEALGPVLSERDLPALSKAKKLDYLVYGRLFDQGNYSFVEVSVYEHSSDSVIFKDNYPLAMDSLESRAREILDDLMPLVLGYTPAGLRVKVEPPDALVSLSSQRISGLERVSKGSVSGDLLSPGTYKIEIEGPGYKSRSAYLTLASGEAKELSFTLDALPATLFRVVSDPPEAEVYDGTLYLGKTPYVYSLSSEQRLLNVQKEGHEPKLLVLSASEGGIGEPKDVAVRLTKKIFSWKDEIALRRDSFYESLGLFALSLGPPLIFNSLYTNIASSLPRTYDNSLDYDRYLSLAEQGNLFYYLSLGSLLVSAVALVDSGIKLSEYLGAVEQARGDN